MPTRLVPLLLADARLTEDLRRDAFRPSAEREQDMLGGGDAAAMTQASGFLTGGLIYA